MAFFRQLACILCALLVVGSLGEVHAQSRSGSSVATFLTLGTGAKGSALGHAYTAVAAGGDALFWNPGAAAVPYQGQLGNAFFTRYDWVADIGYSAAGVTIPVTGTGVVGLSIASVDYGRMDVRTEAQPEGNGETFGASDFSFGLTYSQPLTSSFYFGGTVKSVRQTIRDMRASSIAVDLGFVLETRYLNGAKIAASIMNFGGKMQMSGVNTDIFVDVAPDNSGSNPDIPADLALDEWDLPLSFKFGVAVPVLNTTNVQVLLLADSHQTNDNDLNSDVGAQFQYGTRTFTFNLRAGYKDLFLDNVDNHVSYGAGLDIRVASVRVGFDYAYLPFDFLGDTQLMDFRVYF